MRNKVVLFVLGFIIWTLLTWKPDPEHLLVGLFISGFIAFLTGDLFTSSAHRFTHLNRYLWFFYYIPLFFWECFKANLDVAWRVVHPKIPLNPGIVKVKTKLHSDVALTFLANSITLTPGTLTVDIDKKKKVLYIHWIDVKSDEKVAKRIVERFESIVERFESILRKIFE